jgi:xylulokinase
LAKDITDQGKAYTLLDEEAPADPTGVFVLPYLAGAGTPYMDTQTPAAIAGLRLNTTRGKLFRAFLEGETYEMMLNIECLSDAGINIKKIITVGGGSRSSLWMQIRANVFNRTIYLPDNKEAGTLASALLCYANIGHYRSIEEAQKEMVRFDSKYIPDEKEAKIYTKFYEKYKKLYHMIKELYQ